MPKKKHNKYKKRNRRQLNQATKQQRLTQILTTNRPRMVATLQTLALKLKVATAAHRKVVLPLLRQKRQVSKAVGKITVKMIVIWIV